MTLLGFVGNLTILDCDIFLCVSHRLVHGLLGPRLSWLMTMARVVIHES